MRRDSIGLELRSLNHLMRRHINNVVQEKGLDTVTGTNGWIIDFLAHSKGVDVYQKDLENHFSISPSTASRTLLLMEQKGLIERQSVKHDARLKRLVLTDRALEFHKLMKEDSFHIEDVLRKGFSDEEIDVLFDDLRRLRENLLKEG